MSDGMTDESRRDRATERRLNKVFDKHIEPVGGLITDPMQNRIRKLEALVAELEKRVDKLGGTT